jgi:iron complex outermembrane receptor protein
MSLRRPNGRRRPHWRSPPACAAGGAPAADDRYQSNGDDSGRLDFSYTNPVLGLRWTPGPGLNLHASVARGHESPTLGEVAYRPAGGGGLNADLQARRPAARPRWVPSGARRAGLDLAVFETRVDDEIGVATNAGGRSTFQNVGRTLRRGAELAGRWQPAAAWRWRWRRPGWTPATATPSSPAPASPARRPPCRCRPATAWPARSVPAALPKLAWRGAAWGEWALELRGMARTAVNDANSDFAPGYG